MTEPPYSNREIDQKFERIVEKLDIFETDTRNSLTRIETKADGIDNKVTYTNGKVRKIIISLVALAAFSMGLGLTEAAPLLKLLLAI